MMHSDARAVLTALQLSPHPEGGFYRRTFASDHHVLSATGQSRLSCTSIYYLLPGGSFSAFHRVRADEFWHVLDGDPAELHGLDAHGVHTTCRLGRNVLAGEQPQAVVRAQQWQAVASRGERFTLFGCVVAPGFDCADFELPSRATLLTMFPQHAKLIEMFTREK